MLCYCSSLIDCLFRSGKPAESSAALWEKECLKNGANAGWATSGEAMARAYSA